MTTANVQIAEVDYSCSPGGVNCWEVFAEGLGFLDSFATLAEAVAYVVGLFPKQELNLNIKSLEWWHQFHSENNECCEHDYESGCACCRQECDNCWTGERICH